MSNQPRYPTPQGYLSLYITVRVRQNSWVSWLIKPFYLIRTNVQLILVPVSLDKIDTANAENVFHKFYRKIEKYG